MDLKTRPLADATKTNNGGVSENKQFNHYPPKFNSSPLKMDHANRK